MTSRSQGEGCQKFFKYWVTSFLDDPIACFSQFLDFEWFFSRYFQIIALIENKNLSYGVHVDLDPFSLSIHLNCVNFVSFSRKKSKMHTYVYQNFGIQIYTRTPRTILPKLPNPNSGKSFLPTKSSVILTNEGFTITRSVQSDLRDLQHRHPLEQLGSQLLNGHQVREIQDVNNLFCLKVFTDLLFKLYDGLCPTTLPFPLSEKNAIETI